MNTNYKTNDQEYVNKLWAMFLADKSNIAVRNELIELHLPWIRNLAHQTRRRGGNHEIDELIQRGCMAMLRLMMWWDGKCSFVTYAWKPLLLRMIQADTSLRRAAYRERVQYFRTINLEMHAKCRQLNSHDVSIALGIDERQLHQRIERVNRFQMVSIEGLDGFRPVDPVQDLDAMIEEQWRSEIIRLSLKNLNENDRALIDAVYFGGMSMSGFGEQSGVTREWVSVCHSRIVTRLRRILGRIPTISRTLQ